MGVMVVFFLVIGLGLVWIVATYNGLVGLRNQCKNGFSQIDVQLKRRYDLIPNLVETAKGYMAHERQTLEAVIAARNQAFAANQAVGAQPDNPQMLKNLLGAESTLGASLGKFTVTLESYPELKANQNMSQLMEELSSTENKIAFARQAYNDAVMLYNNRREMFPGSLISGAFGFQPGQAYEIENASERQSVKVNFS